MLLKFIAAAFLIGAFSIMTFAQDATTTKVRFAKGKSAATYKGKISESEGVQHYEFTAKAGQKLTVSVISANKSVKLSVYPSGSANTLGDAENVPRWSGTLDDDGNYIVTVQSLKGAANFSLNIAIK